jgi:hypothetical protein
MKEKAGGNDVSRIAASGRTIGDFNLWGGVCGNAPVKPTGATAGAYWF